MKLQFAYSTAIVLFTLAAFAGDVASDIELTGTLDIDVPADETWEYSGTLSGPGSIL